ncbi:hypothetical protein IGB42_00987 [Andreprevotia sp. IGB-42]|uniref:DUF2863 family protein n=1 Tax=Andreprevotia sp. IGB-42 TaxID=2497473 RepID=UPI0013578DCA|nr:DUF2863 family protein [Andreprevotia sp. IGB-42]KAF0814090.1 hypothetical protein IGB42_00987 [Andreprevotia sp. IGB-42]
MLKRNRPARRGRTTADETELMRLANGLADSSSRVEDSFWEALLTHKIATLLAEREEDVLNSALDAVSQSDGRAYEALADMIEGACESTRIVVDGQSWDALLIAAPALAWSRWQISGGSINPDTLQNLKVQLGAHTLAKGTRLALADFLFSPDQLPRGFTTTAELTQFLTEAALAGQHLHVDTTGMPETRMFLADTRYLLGVVAAPAGQPLFRWQEEDGERETAFEQWQKQGSAVMQGLLNGSTFELAMPGAYHSAWREADRLSRGYSIQATVAFLTITLGLEPRQLQAVIGQFHGTQLEEYRVGFSKFGEDTVLHGVVWPLLDGEDVHTDCIAEMEAILKEIGVTAVHVHEQDFPLEYCDDCGSPYYPNLDGELLHTEMPEEEAGVQPATLH